MGGPAGNRQRCRHYHLLHGLSRLTFSGIEVLPSFPRESTISSSTRFVVEGVFRESGVVHSFKMVDPVLCLDLTSCIPEISSSFLINRTDTQMKFCKVVARTTLLYGSETWGTTTRDMTRLEAAEMRFLRSINL